MAGCCVVITSCLAYADSTLPPLLASLDKAGVPKDHIHVVVGECDADDDVMQDGIAMHRRTWCNIDNNGLMWVCMEQPPLQDWIVYLHDTSYVADSFWESCRAIVDSVEPGTTCIRLHAPFSMGMGFYSLAWVTSQAVQDYMRGLLNYDLAAKPGIKADLCVLEDTLFKFAERGHGDCMTLPNAYSVVDSNVQMYGTKTPRLVEYYSTPGVYKVKANWGQSHVMKTVL